MIRPTLDRVLLQKVEREKETESGLIIPNDDALSGEFYEVKKLGPALKVEDEDEETYLDLDVGDVVVVADFMVEEIEEADESYAIVEYEDILGVKE